MGKLKYLSKSMLAICLLSVCETILADSVRVAVASNFMIPAREIAAAFEAHTDQTAVTLSFASTGKHYAQIVNGAPFQVFLAADVERPEKLDSENMIIKKSRFTYAIGRLALWSPVPGVVDRRGHVLANAPFEHLAIANPRTAPYGLAAQQALVSLGHWDRWSKRLLRGENINQALLFVRSGNAEMGLVAWSLVMDRPGSSWLVPESHHQPILQQAVLLKDEPGAIAFHQFLKSSAALAIIRAHGYATP